MSRRDLAYHVCHGTLRAAFHMLVRVAFAFLLCVRVCRDGTLAAPRGPPRGVRTPSNTSPHGLIPNGVNSTPCKNGADNSWLFPETVCLTPEKAHNRTQPGTGLNVLNKLMKSTHRTQGGHDKNLYSCETQPSRESASSARLFICLFDSPRRSAGGAGGPTKVTCQRWRA